MEKCSCGSEVDVEYDDVLGEYLCESCRKEVEEQRHSEHLTTIYENDRWQSLSPAQKEAEIKHAMR